MFPRSVESVASQIQQSVEIVGDVAATAAQSDALVGIDDVQKSLNRSRASVYRYTNTDPRNLNPPFNPRKLNPEYRSDQKDPLLFHPNEVARFAKDVLRIKEVTVEVLNYPPPRHSRCWAPSSRSSRESVPTLRACRSRHPISMPGAIVRIGLLHDPGVGDRMTTFTL